MGGNNANGGAAQYEYMYQEDDAHDDDASNNPSPLLQYVTIAYLVLALCCVWPIAQCGRRIKKKRKIRKEKANSLEAKKQSDTSGKIKNCSKAAAPAASSNTSQAGTVSASVVSAGTRNTRMTHGTRNTRISELSSRSGRTNFSASTAQTFPLLASHRRRRVFVAANLAVEASKEPSSLLPPSGHVNKTDSDDLTPQTAGDDEQYFPMHNFEDAADYLPQGCLIICCVDNDIDEETERNDIVATEDVVEEGAWGDFEWNELPDHVRDAATLLGCTGSVMWNFGGISRKKSWQKLSQEEQQAARILGYKQKLWDHEEVTETRSDGVTAGLDTWKEVIKYDRESRMIARVAIPSTLETIFGTILDAIEIGIMSEYLGYEALSAYAVVHSCLGIAYNIGYGLADAEDILLCQAIGRGDHFLAGQYTLLSIVTYIVAAAPFYIATIFFIDEIILYLGLGEDVASKALEYIPILALSHLIQDGATNVLSGLLRCSGRISEMASIDTVSSILHVAAVAVAVIRFDVGLPGLAWIEVGTSVGYGVFIFGYATYKGWLKPFLKGLSDITVVKKWDVVHKMIGMTLPLAWSNFLSDGEWSILSFFAGYMGSADLAAWTILGSIWGIFEYAPEGCNTAVVMRVGYHLGRGDPRNAKITAYKCLYFSTVLALFISSLFLSFSKEIINFFSESQYIKDILQDSVALIGVGNIILCLGNASSVILSAQGRPTTSAWIYFLCVWGISLPLSAWFTLGLAYNTVALVCAMLLSYATASVVLLCLILTTNWAKMSMLVIAHEVEEEVEEEHDGDSTLAQSTEGIRGIVQNRGDRFTGVAGKTSTHNKKARLGGPEDWIERRRRGPKQQQSEYSSRLSTNELV